MGITPLEFLMSVIRDPKAKSSQRLDAAKAAAPYMHRKMPIAIEGGESDRPISLTALHALTDSELQTLQSLLVKAGVGEKQETADALEEAPDS